MKFVVENNIENIPCDFFKIVTDFANDICRVFTEYNSIVSKYILSDKEKTDVNKLKLYNFVGKVILQNKDFILSKNEELFLNTDENVLNTEFLPRIVFSHIWGGDISEITKTTIWKYLTLLYVTISKQQHGDKEDIDLDEILSGIMDEHEPIQLPEEEEEKTQIHQQPQIPGIGELPEQLQSMMGGSLGKLAMELAQETTMDGVENKGTMDLFSMMGKIGNKIENKLKSGELSESSLLEESMGLINSMGGVGNIQSMMNMFKGGSTKGFDLSALQKMTETQPEQPKGRNGKNSQKTTDKKARQKLRGNNPRNNVPKFTDDELERIFSSK